MPLRRIQQVSASVARPPRATPHSCAYVSATHLFLSFSPPSCMYHPILLSLSPPSCPPSAPSSAPAPSPPARRHLRGERPKHRGRQPPSGEARRRLSGPAGVRVVIVWVRVVGASCAREKTAPARPAPAPVADGEQRRSVASGHAAARTQSRRGCRGSAIRVVGWPGPGPADGRNSRIQGA